MQKNNSKITITYHWGNILFNKNTFLLPYFLCILHIVIFHIKSALDYVNQHAMSPEFGGKEVTESLTTGFPLPTLLCVGYSLKRKKES